MPKRKVNQTQPDRIGVPVVVRSILPFRARSIIFEAPEGMPDDQIVSLYDELIETFAQMLINRGVEPVANVIIASDDIVAALTFSE